MSRVDEFNSILDSFKINAECVGSGEKLPYMYFDVRLEPKTKIKSIERYADEISLALKATRPTFKILYEQGILRIEFLKYKKPSASIIDLIKKSNPNNQNISCIVGQTLQSENVILDFKNYPHLLVAGTTGSGKTVLLHNIIANLIYNKSARLWLIDPKQIEFSQYKPISFRYSNTYDQSVRLLKEINANMEFAFSMINSNPTFSILPTFLIIDEFADLVLQDDGNEFFTLLCKLAQKCRAVNMHIVLSTQRPSVDVIRGIIKANFAQRISCKVSTIIDSKVILDAPGAQHLLGQGDALIKDHVYNMERFQVAYSSKEEILKLHGNA